jgi:hypothetical protein
MRSGLNGVERIETLDQSRFQREYAAKGKPFILTTASLSKWNLDYLAEKQGHIEVTVEHYPSGDRNKPWDYQTMTMNDYVERIRIPSERCKYYLANKFLDKVLPALTEDVPRPSFIGDHLKSWAEVFIGIDTYSAFHYHGAPIEAFLIQVSGRKRILLLSSEHFRSLYPNAWFRPRHNWSKISLNAEGGQEPFASLANTMLADGRYPKAAAAPIVDCMLNEGEGLFIPQGWFHAVYGIGESISVTHFFLGSKRHAHRPILVRDSLAGMRKRYISRPLTRMARFLRPS